MIFLQLSLFGKLTIILDLDWVWTKWYKIVNGQFVRSYASGIIQLQILWFIYLELKFPMKSSAKEAMKWLPPTYRG